MAPPIVFMAETEGLFSIANRIGYNPSVSDKTLKYYGFCRDSSLYTREPWFKPFPWFVAVEIG